MAVAPTAAPAPAAADEAAMTPDAAPAVICTILKNPDGTYALVAGDEPEPGAEGGGTEAPGQSYDSIGQLLKGVLDIVQTDADGGETGADQMRAGYAAGGGAAPAA